MSGLAATLPFELKQIPMGTTFAFLLIIVLKESQLKFYGAVHYKQVKTIKQLNIYYKQALSNACRIATTIQTVHSTQRVETQYAKLLLYRTQASTFTF